MNGWLLTLIGFVVLSAWMAFLWKASRRIHNAGLVDVGWATGLAFLGVLYATFGPGDLVRRALIGSMVLLWGLRLSLHLYFDRVMGKPEDPRYASLRREWKDTNGKKFFWFFQFQGALALVLALPFLIAAINTDPMLYLLEYAATGLWVVAFFGETLADYQLTRFKANRVNRGKTCRVGLWNYSRHPNYFFEWLIWVSYALFALSSPWGWWGWLSPVLMLYFLLKVTGIPATEQQALHTRGDDYRDYQRTTSMFVPWFKK